MNSSRKSFGGSGREFPNGSTLLLGAMRVMLGPTAGSAQFAKCYEKWRSRVARISAGDYAANVTTMLYNSRAASVLGYLS